MVEPTRHSELDVAPDRNHADPVHSPENPLLLAHRLLRGRYPYAIALGLVLAVIGAGVARVAIKPKFESSGIIQVTPAMPKMLYESEESKVPPLFDSFVSAQGEFVKTRRVIDLALQDEELTNAGWPSGPGGVALLREKLTTKVPKGGQIIIVSVEEDNAVLAQQAVNAVLRAYKRLYIDERGQAKLERQQFLEQRQTTLQAELRTLHDRIGDLAKEFGADNIARLHSAKVDELTGLDTKIRELDITIAQAEASQGADAAPGGLIASADEEQGAPGEPVPDTLVERETLENMLATKDRTLADFLSQEFASRRELESLRSAGYGPQHRQVKKLENSIEALRGQINDRVALLKDQLGPEEIPTADANAATTPEQLRALRGRYQRMRDDVQKDTESLATRRRLIANLQDEAKEKDQLFNDTRTALEQLRVEKRQQDEATGRVNIASWGDAPVNPASDKRLPAMAAGFLGGFGAGVGLVAILGLLNPLCRFVGDMEHPARSAPLLGTLPDLDSGDPEQDELAAMSVHQIRNILELQRPSRESPGFVLAVTSAMACEGKTSLTMALGMSFAAAGQRTLIVDADLVGHGVTRQLKLDNCPGLRELTEPTELEACVHSTPVCNLYAMPTGSTEGFEPKNLSRVRSVYLMEELRSVYDVVLLDTGPLLGSLEGNLICGLSDATILVVTRGQKSKLVQASLERINNIGGRCAGIVFNRAMADDYLHSVSHASFHVASVRSSSQPTANNGEMAGSYALTNAVAGVGFDKEYDDGS